MSRRTSAFAWSVAAGAIAGFWLARERQHATQRDLFDRSAWRRLGALGWLERTGDTTALPLLRDYLAWEQRPVLRARGERVLRTLERAA